MVRGIDPLLAKRRRGLAQPFPGFPQILRQILGQGRFGRGPAVVRLTFADPRLAVIALSAAHVFILWVGFSGPLPPCAGPDSAGRSLVIARLPALNLGTHVSIKHIFA